MKRVGVLGATGYVGQELIRLIYRHKEMELVKVSSDSYAGTAYSSVYRNFTGYEHLICQELNVEAMAEGVDVLFSALPYGVLMQKLTKNIMDQVSIIDLGVDYRMMNADEYRMYYKKEHQSIELSKEFVYGLSEWNQKAIRSARHIANPGCFATAIELALLPLVKEHLLEHDVIVDGKTSLSASGKTLTVGTHYAEANESVKPYKILKHPHGLESRQAIDLFTGQDTNIIFVPHLMPMQRGLLVSCYGTLSKEITDGEVRNIYHKYYPSASFVKLLEPGMYVETKWVRNSNMCHINFEIDQAEHRIFIFAAIDNLQKGAAGQAVQNFNLMNGYPEDMGLDEIPICI